MIDLQPLLEKIDNKPIAVFGLGLSGLATVKAFTKAGNVVHAWDDYESAQKKASDLGANVQELTPDILKTCAFLCLAPGVPLTHPAPHPVVRAAQDAECEILCDIEILHRLHHNRSVIGLTGTNGKSTTTTLIQHILTHSHIQSTMGGNIGLPILDTILPPKDGKIVLELSSFQLDLCSTFQPDIALLLNITPDHIDRHGSMEGYIKAKEKIFNGSGTAIIGVDDQHSKAMCARIQSKNERRIIPISCAEVVESGVYIINGTLYDDIDGEAQELGSLNSITKLHGQHNKQNAAAAYAACKIAGLSSDDIVSALKSYPGLPHRQYPVRIINGVAYINDSKATNAEATSKALACNNNIYWIVGGQAKEGGLEGLQPFLDRIKHAFLIGESADNFQKWLEKHGVETSNCHTLERAIHDAHQKVQDERGQPGGSSVVLLSPACSSYDQFKSFEERGDHFSNIVNDLQEDKA